MLLLFAATALVSASCGGDSSSSSKTDPDITPSEDRSEPSKPTQDTQDTEDSTDSQADSGSDADNSQDSADQALLPSDPTGYDVELSGQTEAWNGQSQSYETAQEFDRNGTLIVEPHPSGDGYAVGVLSGSFSEFGAGTLHFVSNSYVLRHVDSVADFNWKAQLDVARVTADEQGGSLSVEVSGDAARTEQLNNFALGTEASPKQILEGKLNLDFADDGTVSGKLDLYGGGYIEPGNSFPVDRIEASVSGQAH
jgi:hypothetical protein